MRRRDVPVDEIVRLYGKEGISENRLAKRYGVDRSVISRVIREADVHRRGQSEAEVLKWIQMTPEQRKHQVEAVHNAIRGRRKTRDFLRKRAKGIQRKARLSSLEKSFLEVFDEYGIKVVPQYAIDIFNVDFAIPEIKLAIEIDGGGWHQSEPKIHQDRKKKGFLSFHGWYLIRFKGKHLKFIRLLIAKLRGK